MENTVVVAFDMDDTLVKTTCEVERLYKLYCENNKVGERSKEEIINKEVIEKRVYMDSAEPTELFYDLKKYLGDLREKYKDSLKVVICSHRGDNTSAWLSSFNWLLKHELMDDIDMIHSINSVNNKDKLKYLEGVYPYSEIILVDDNPFGSKNEIREYDSRLVVYGKELKNKCVMNQEGYVNIFILMSKIMNKIDNLMD